MAMASVSISTFLLLLLCSYGHSLAAAHAGGGLSYKVLDTGKQLKSDAACSEHKAVASSGGATVALHHRYGPCSPVNSTAKPTLEEMLRRDQLRAAYVQRKFSGAKRGGAGGVQQSDATVPTTLGTSLNTLEYVITVGIGSPAVTQTMLIDTGSDVSWVQCSPCAQCHSQADALFDPSASRTYSPFSCGAAACAQLGQEGNGCSASQCQYIVNYGDGSTTTGTYGSDTLSLGSNAVRSFQFGCSRSESGFGDQTDGLMGLGGGAQSLVSQTAGTFGKAFSYCLPATAGSSGFLTLGAGGAGGFVKTPLLRSSQVPTFYGVRLQGIRVGGKQVSVPASAFAAGTIMDSGTIITRLPPTAYSALSSAFKAAMAGKYPAAQPSGILDTCFDFGGQSSVSIPSVALVFSGGAVVDLDGSGIILDSCLAFAPNGDDGSLGIIGNVQQRTFEVLYDVGRGAVGFRSGAC
ncbi:hypothetical protein ACP4OV_001027 [Aristida adscensionis]